METIWKNIIIPFLKFIAPIVYLLFWVLLLEISQGILGDDVVKNPVFIIASLAILFMGVIAKSSSWSIFGDKGIKGDSLGKYLDFHSGGNPPWDYKIYMDNEEKTISKLKDSEKIVEKINIGVLRNEKEKTK